ncbi:MAG: glycosyltransferase family 4 protein [Desulfobulbaceae bacterium]|nr:glycosyltransferase family 4 protein [Desulfobulbaceae bacterium]
MNNIASTQQSSKPKVLALADHLGHPNGKIHGGTTYFVNHYPAMSSFTNLIVCFLSPRHPAATRLQDKNIKPIFLKRGKWNPLALWDIFKIIRKRKVDIIHLHSEKSMIIGGILSATLGIPSILHIHDAIPLKYPLLPLQRWAIKKISAAILITDELRDHALNEYGFPPERINIINYGMDLSPFQNVSPKSRERIRRELSIKPSAPVISLVGRVNRDKGQLEMITAMSTVVKTHPNAKLFIVGDGPAMDECREKVNALQLAETVFFLGQRDDIAEILTASDLVTVPSMWHEGFGFVALEAIAAGRPVVAFDSGGLPNTVIHSKTGLLVKQGDVEGLAKAVTKLLDDPIRMKAMAKEGRKHAERFSINHHVKQLKKVYHSVLTQKNEQPLSTLLFTVGIGYIYSCMADRLKIPSSCLEIVLNL